MTAGPKPTLQLLRFRVSVIVVVYLSHLSRVSFFITLFEFFHVLVCGFLCLSWSKGLSVLIFFPDPGWVAPLVLRHFSVVCVRSVISRVKLLPPGPELRVTSLLSNLSLLPFPSS